MIFRVLLSTSFLLAVPSLKHHLSHKNDERDLRFVTSIALSLYSRSPFWFRERGFLIVWLRVSPLFLDKEKKMLHTHRDERLLDASLYIHVPSKDEHDPLFCDPN